MRIRPSTFTLPRRPARTCRPTRLADWGSESAAAGARDQDLENLVAQALDLLSLTAAQHPPAMRIARRL